MCTLSQESEDVPGEDVEAAREFRAFSNGSLVNRIS